MTITKNINKEMYVKMKSRKLKAIFAALSATAIMATAMTGFAAATTTYDAVNNKVIVTETVKADAGKEVTYLVKSNNQIVYIDQATADESGNATFSYKIAGGKLAEDLSTVATFGTDGANAVTGGSPSLALKKFSDIDAEMYTVTFTKAIAGNDDTAHATVAAKDGYEITDVKINGATQGVVKQVELDIDDELIVEAKKAYTAPTINAEETTVGEMTDDTSLNDGKTYQAITTVISYTGDFEAGDIGVVCGEYYYPAMVAKGGKAAVKLILPDGAENVKVEAWAK